MKKLIILFFALLFSIAGYSQMNTFGGIGLRVNDTTTYQTNAVAFHTAGYYDIYFNNQATNDHWDIWNGSGYDHIFSFSSASGSSVWGGITGTLSNQTDLNSALTGKVATTVTVNGHALSSNVTVTKSDVGLSAADNTSDLSKPVSTLQAAADAATLVSANAYTDTQLAVVATEAINGAVTLDDTDFGKVHTLTDIGSPADYTVTVPTPSGSNTGKTIYFKGLSTLTKVVTLSSGAVTFAGYSNWKLSREGLVGLLSDGTNYKVVAENGSWIPWTPGFGAGFSVNPSTFDCSYFKTGRLLKVRFKAGTSGTSNANTFTITGLPFAARIDQYFIGLVQDGGVNKAGLIYTTSSSTTIGLQPLPATTAWTTTLAKNAYFTIDIEL